MGMLNSLKNQTVNLTGKEPIKNIRNVRFVRGNQYLNEKYGMVGSGRSFYSLLILIPKKLGKCLVLGRRTLGLYNPAWQDASSDNS